MYVDQVLAILLTKQLSSLSIKYSCINQVLMSINQVLRSNSHMYVNQVLTIRKSNSHLSIKYSNMCRSSTPIYIDEATLICIDQVLMYQSSTHVYQLSTHVYRSNTSMYVDQVLTILSTKQLSSVSINTHVQIKYSCLSIKYSNVYRSSTRSYVNQVLTILSMEQLL